MATDSKEGTPTMSKSHRELIERQPCNSVCALNVLSFSSSDLRDHDDESKFHNAVEEPLDEVGGPAGAVRRKPPCET